MEVFSCFLCLMMVFLLKETEGQKSRAFSYDEQVLISRKRNPTANIPLRAEKEPAHSLIPGCTFGGQYYALEARWHPFLENFGEMVCVVCVCTPVNQDGDFVGKLRCDDIKSQCREPQCEEPILRPGQCCKTCPEDDVPASSPRGNNDFSNSDIANIDAEDEVTTGEDRNSEMYVSLMTNRLIGSRSHGVARASITLIGNDLFFTIHYTRTQTPTEIVFTDALNTTLKTVTANIVRKGKICGEWKNVPSIYLRFLRQELLFISINTEQKQDGDVLGRIIHHRALESESFSTLLTMPRKRSPVNSFLGMGGIVVMSVSANGESLNYAVMLDGVVETYLDRSDDITVTFQLLYKQQVVVTTHSTVTVDMRIVVGVMSHLPRNAQKWIARGRLSMKVSVGSDQGVLIGGVKPYDTCNTFHAVLSGSEAMGRPKATGASGSAIFNVESDGTITYQIQLAGLNTEVVALTLEANTNRRRIIADLLDDMENGKVIGSYSKPKAKEIQMLIHGGLYVNVGTEGYHTSELRGQIKQLPYNSAMSRFIESPIQLSGASIRPRQLTGAAGHAWLVLDEHCHLHYEIAVMGLNNGDERSGTHMYAEIGSMVEDRPVVQQALRAFTSDLASGTIQDMEPNLLRMMNKGQAFIQVSTKSHRDGEIRGQVILPNDCYDGRNSLQPGDNRVPSVGTRVENLPDSCFFEGRHRISGSVWYPDYDKQCTTCICRKSVVICDPVVCPPLACENPVTLPDDCCPSCPIEPVDEISPDSVSSDADTCYFEGDRRNHRVGTQWHPYVPPFGYIRCAICTCQVGGITNCSRVTCPALNCPNPIRASPSDCCQVCPEPEPTEVPVNVFLQGDEVERGCSFHEEFYRHGDDWQPHVNPFGVVPCVRCRCRNGQTKCKRRSCPELTCTKQFQPKRDCCAKCAEEEESIVSVSSSSLPSNKRTKRKT